MARVSGLSNVDRRSSVAADLHGHMLIYTGTAFMLYSSRKRGTYMDPIVIYPPAPTQCYACHGKGVLTLQQRHTLSLDLLKGGSSSIKSGVFTSKPTGMKPLSVKVAAVHKIAA